MKKLAAIELLFVLVFSMTGIMVIFRMQQYIIGKEVKQTIRNSVPGNELYCIRISQHQQSQLSWTNDNDFKFRGSLYDMVRKEVQDDSFVIYYCIYDTLETNLFANLDKLIKKKPKQNMPAKRRARKILKLFSKTALSPHNQTIFHHLVTCLLKFNYFNNYHSPEILFPSPIISP